MLTLLLAGTGTALATGLGAIPVFFLGERAAALRPLLLGVAAGAMSVASVAGLLLPGLDEGSTLAVVSGTAAGILFLVGARGALEARQRHVERALSAGSRTSLLVFVVLLVHSLPEGFAIGTAYASDTAGLSLFVIVAIAVQNIPEGTSIAIPMAGAGFSRSRQFWAAVLSSAPQPVGALIAYLLVEEIEPLLPVSFGFAAGAMLALVVAELLPSSLRENLTGAVAGGMIGAAAMLALSAALGV
ncbi:MAG TPA: ZIP family metal transporter [Solirubrobacterales bacterium]|nr:ZIP family metal transporter [Solirubrobacterales bacterium]